MTWSAPKTYTAGGVLTAAEMNQYQRDNLLETCPAAAAAAGDMVYADAANSMGSRLPIGSVGSLLVSDGSEPVWRAPTQAKVNVSESTTSTSYTDLSTPGPSVTLVTGAAALVFITSALSNSNPGNSAFVAVDVSGASSYLANDNDALQLLSATASASMRATRTVWLTGLTPGSNTFTLKYRSDGATASFNLRQIVVIPFS